jgi:hypothetical protein
MQHDDARERQESSLIGRILSLEVALFLMGVASLIYGLVNGIGTNIFFGALIMPGVSSCIRSRKRIGRPIGQSWKNSSVVSRSVIRSVNVIVTEPEIVLASASPRRSELLELAGISFRTAPADIPEEPLPGEEAVPHALRLAEEKPVLQHYVKNLAAFLSVPIPLWCLMDGSWVNRWMIRMLARCYQICLAAFTRWLPPMRCLIVRPALHHKCGLRPVSVSKAV